MTEPRKPPLWTPDEVAAYVQVDIRTVRRWIADGKLGSVKLGSARRIRESELRKFMQKKFD